MKSWTWLLFGATAVSCAPGVDAPAPPRPTDAIDSPEAAVTTYFRASDTASSKLLRAAFHPATHMQWIDEAGAPRLLTQAEWWLRTDAVKTPTPASDRKLAVLDREGPFAMIEAVSSWPTHTFDDLLLVAHLPTGWRIVGKLFERLAPGASASSDPGDDAAIRAVIAQKIEAHAASDPALLSSSHMPLCLYVALQPGLRIDSLSDSAAQYAARRDAGETDRDAAWRVLGVVVRGRIAAVKTDVVARGKRYVDHLLLLKTHDGWKIAAVAWGDPTAT